MPGDYTPLPPSPTPPNDRWGSVLAVIGVIIAGLFCLAGKVMGVI